MEETFTYDDMNRLTGITLKRLSGQDLYCSATYDAFGRMTSKEAVTKVNNVPQVTTVFSLPVFANTKVHALSQAQTSEGVFPSTDQTVTYTGFDKVSKVKQGTDSICYSYGYDRQRISMEEHVGGALCTKRYVGNCEYVTETTGGYTETQWLTYLSGPTGVFAVMAMEGGDAKIHYILKDNLGSWATITNEDGVVEQRLSYDAWGNLRDPQTWSGSFTGTPMFDRGYTGHEHLTAFGLVNMNGRMYDPVVSSFLSADRYVQDPSSAQGFNRYAYCLYNPLRYVDPSGWKPKQRVYGPISSSYYARDFYTFAERAYEPGDFRNAYYMLNEALYGDMGGPGGGGGGGQGGNYYGSYGYYVTHYASSVYNHTFPSAQFQLIRNWHNNPCYSTNKEMRDAGITNVTAGEAYGSYQGEDGYRNTYYTWTDSNGHTRTATALGEYVGGNKNGAFTVSNQPLEMYNMKFSETIKRIGRLPYDIERNGAAMQLASYKMNYNVIVDAARSSIYINANSYNTPIMGGMVIPSAKVTLINNGQTLDSKPLVNMGEASFNSAGYDFVGSTTFSLPSSGSIKLRIEGGWNVSFYPCGNYVPTFFGVPINSNTIIVIQ